MSVFSVLILTLDEEANLPRCLQALSWADDIVVLDSFSADATVEIAEQAGVRVFRRAFDCFAGQRNWGMENIDFKHPWVFHLDADEVMPEALCEAAVAAAADDRHSAYFVPCKMIFLGRWLRWAGLYPSYQVRLVKRGEVEFCQHGHGQRETNAQRGVGVIDEPYLHYSFSKGLDEWIARHNNYSRQECRQILEERAGGRLDLGGLLRVGDAVRRRRAVKTLAARLPCRPLLRFVYMYFFRLGVLDGRAGFTYCRLLALYESMIQLKLAAAGLEPVRGGEAGSGDGG